MKKFGGLLLLISIMIMGSLVISYADESPYFEEAAGQLVFVSVNEEGFSLSDSNDETATLMQFNDEGRGEAYTGIYEGKYYMSGMVYRPEAEEYADIDGLKYVIGTDGSIAAATAIVDGQYYYKGKASTVSGVRFGLMLQSGKVLTGVTGKVAAGGYIYSVASDGSAQLYLKQAACEYLITACTVNGKKYLYKVNPATGAAVKFTGIKDSIYYRDGVKSAVTGVENDTLLKDGKVWTGVTGKVAAGGYIYSVTADGNAKLYLRNTACEYLITACAADGKKYLYKADPATGAAVKFTGIKDGSYYSSGVKEYVTGVRCNTLLKNGKVWTGVTGKVVTGGYLYQVSENGDARLGLKARYGTYYATAKTLGGTRYVYTVDSETGKAEKSILDKNAKSYILTIDGKAYEVFCDTAEYVVYSGYYLGRYYEDGKTVDNGGITYKVSGGYAYKVSAHGVARKYIRNKNGKGTYRLKDNDLIYEVSESTGKVKESYSNRIKMVECARKYIGYNEDNKSHRVIIDIYNSQKKLPRGYAVRYDDEWCATFVSTVAIKSGYSSKVPLECSCYYQMLKWMAMGKWIENDAYVPSPGDVIYYDWDDNGKGNCTGIPDHVGIVESVSNGKITVIEGNKNRRVARRVIYINSRYIRGFGKLI